MAGGTSAFHPSFHFQNGLLIGAHANLAKTEIMGAGEGGGLRGVELACVWVKSRLRNCSDMDLVLSRKKQLWRGPSL